MLHALIASNGPFVSTGYGVQTKLMMQMFQELGHKVSVVAFFGLEGAATQIGNVIIYPGGHQMYGVDVIKPHALHAKADIVMTLYDAWVYDPRMFSGLRWTPYFPIDCDGLPDAIRLPVSRSYQPIVMSRFGERMAHAANIDCRYAPHSYDPEIYYPVDKRAARESQNMPTDRWIVGICGKNSSASDRKALIPQIAAFAQFKRGHPDALLYLHTDLNASDGRGINLHPVLAHYDLEPKRDYIAVSDYAGYLGVDEAIMRQLYGSMDVLSMVSLGEGFGVPLIEAQACGRPIITGDWTSMGELCRSGIRVSKADAEPSWSAIGAYHYKARIGALVQALEDAYRSPVDEPDVIRERISEYEMDRVAQTYWKPLLSELEERVDKHKALAAGGQLVAAGLP